MAAAAQRREAIMERLANAVTPVPATRLGHELGVSRQIIVGDIALLRAAGHTIRATNRGYLLVRHHTPPRRLFHVHHAHGGAALHEAEAELGVIIDAGGTVLDVSVDHSAYGSITVDLNLHNRADLTDLIRHLETDSLLCRLTAGHHTHLVEARDEETLDAVERSLDQLGFLEHAPATTDDAAASTQP